MTVNHIPLLCAFAAFVGAIVGLFQLVDDSDNRHARANFVGAIALCLLSIAAYLFMEKF